MPRRNTSVLPDPVTPNSSSGAGSRSSMARSRRSTAAACASVSCGPWPVTAGAGTASETTDQPPRLEPPQHVGAGARRGSQRRQRQRPGSECRQHRGLARAARLARPVERRPEGAARRRGGRQHELQRPRRRRRVARGDLERQLHEVGRGCADRCRGRSSAPGRRPRPGRPPRRGRCAARAARRRPRRPRAPARPGSRADARAFGSGRGGRRRPRARGPNGIPLPSRHGPPPPDRRLARAARGELAPRPCRVVGVGPDGGDGRGRAALHVLP